MPARFIALVTVLRTCGSTYSALALSATLSSKRMRAVLWPQPLMRGMSSSETPTRSAHFFAYSGDARSSAAAPSVTWEQSEMWMRPPMLPLYSSRLIAWS